MPSTSKPRAERKFLRNRSRLAWTVTLFIFLASLCVQSSVSFYYHRRSSELMRISDSFPRDYYVGPQGGKLFVYVALGASTAVGTGAPTMESTYPYRLAESVAMSGPYRVHVINLAQNGATMRQVVSTQLPHLQRWRPDMVTVSAGANDAMKLLPSSSYPTDVRDLVGNLSALRGCKVIVSNTPDIGRAPSVPF